jgi:hypothetical protein
MTNDTNQPASFSDRSQKRKRTPPGVAVLAFIGFGVAGLVLL